jgi:aspartyl-tRNA(Asn)/glutamyl-tRNA(Gln) amidotransferase subunit C
MTAITRAEVAHLAKLARLSLTEDELDHYATQLDVILGAVARVSEVATAEVPATSHPIPMTNVFRPDVRAETLNSQEALQAAPAVEDERFRVPRILDES